MRRAFAAVRLGRPAFAWVAPAVLLLGSPARAQDLYGCDNAGQLFVVNTVTGAGAFVCDLPTHPDPGATEIEYDENSAVAFVQARDGVFSGQRFDVSNCSPTGALVPTSNLAFNGLEFVGGVLFGTAVLDQCAPSILATLDPATGVSATIGPTGQGPIAGLAWEPGTQTMYGITGCSSQGPSRLVRIDLVTGAATVVGSTGQTLGSLELGASGLLYAGGDTRDGGNLYIINPVTASATLVGPTGFSNVTGLALVVRPVPVLISHFDAIPFDGGVRLGWEIVSDEQVAGFKVYRAAAEDHAAASMMDGGMLPASVHTYTDASARAGKSYDYTLVVVLSDRELTSPTVRVQTRSYGMVLDQNSPNPFNPLTTISFTLARRGDTTLSVYDVNGQLVKTLFDGILGEGSHQYLWDGKNTDGKGVSSGVYFYRLASGKQTQTKRMVLLK
jgi:hypothetical protein